MSPIERSAGGGGGGLTSPLTTKGDIWGWTTTNARVPVGTNTQVLTANSAVALGVDYEYPPGHEFDYVQITSSVVVNTAFPSMTTCITGNSVTYDGTTRVKIEVSAPVIETGTATAAFIAVELFDGATDLAELTGATTPAAALMDVPFNQSLFVTPSAGAHQYIVKAYHGASGGNALFAAGTGSGASFVPAYLRITKA